MLIVRAIIVFTFLLAAGCSEPYPAADQEIGPNGEPPEALELIYQKQFLAEEKNYVLAFGIVHRFLVDNQFSVSYNPCFDDVLNIRKRKKGFTCIAVQADQGPPTKVYFRLIVDEVLFNQLDNDNRWFFSIEIYGFGSEQSLIDDFSAAVEPGLAQLYVGEQGR
ncbi:hypothetical protein [Halopseudomonas salegens]|uniref:hypothetical protein n=1 Tax=Halopseudomonas salegens TaxID=1434072 RepID=UPI0012FDC6B4|nr:hypothetical protein [Halopseudomonas salegens]